MHLWVHIYKNFFHCLHLKQHVTEVWTSSSSTPWILQLIECLLDSKWNLHLLHLGLAVPTIQFWIQSQKFSYSEKMENEPVKIGQNRIKNQSTNFHYIWMCWFLVVTGNYQFVQREYVNVCLELFACLVVPSTGGYVMTSKECTKNVAGRCLC